MRHIMDESKINAPYSDASRTNHFNEEHVKRLKSEYVKCFVYKLVANVINISIKSDQALVDRLSDHQFSNLKPHSMFTCRLNKIVSS